MLKYSVYTLRFMFFGTFFMWLAYWLHTWIEVSGANAGSSIGIAATRLRVNASSLLEGRFSDFFADGLIGIIVFGLVVVIFIGALLKGEETGKPRRKRRLSDDDDYDPYYYEDPGIGEEIGGSPHYHH